MYKLENCIKMSHLDKERDWQDSLSTIPSSVELIWFYRKPLPPELAVHLDSSEIIWTENRNNVIHSVRVLEKQNGGGKPHSMQAKYQQVYKKIYMESI